MVGFAVLRALLDAGWTSVRVGHAGPGGARLDDPRVTYVQGDLRDAEACRVLAEGCDTAVMAAAVTGGAAAQTLSPWSQVTDNVVMDLRLLEGFHAAGARAVVYLGSSTVYQDAATPLAEDDLDWNQDPPAPYLGVGWAKRYAEQACKFWRTRGEMGMAVLRLANPYGPYARFEPGRSNVVAALLRKVEAGADPLEVWGGPEVVRDLFHCDDLGTAVAAAAAKAQDGGHHVYNIGSGRGTTIGALAEAALAADDRAGTAIRYDDSRPTTIPYRVLDIAKARRELAWAPRVALPDGLRRTLAWWRDNKETWTR